MAVNDPQILEVCALMSSLVRGMVGNADDVQLSYEVASGGLAIVRIQVARGRAMGKLIGRHGRTACSLRIVFQAIAKEHGQMYCRLDIEEISVEESRS